MPRNFARTTKHFELRVEERLGGTVTKEMRRQINQGLDALLAKGVCPGPNLDVHVGIPGGYVAVCVPSATGGWVAVTCEYFTDKVLEQTKGDVLSECS